MKNKNEIYSNLVHEALIAREYSYCPYSNWAVGAALLTKDGKIYRGCNIENSGFTATSCAERTAFFKAVSEGEKEFSAIAIVGGTKGQPLEGYCYPCGVCRQVMCEFCHPDEFMVINAKSEEDYEVYSLREMIPNCGFVVDDQPQSAFFGAKK